MTHHNSLKFYTLFILADALVALVISATILLLVIFPLFIFEIAFMARDSVVVIMIVHVASPTVIITSLLQQYCTFFTLDIIP